MLSTGVLVSIYGLVCFAAGVHGGAAGNGTLQAPPKASQLAHCPSHCGDVEISYPFGIGPGCFRQGFELNCDKTARPPMLLLGNSTTQITDIYASRSIAFTSTIGYNITMSPGTDTYNRSWEAPAEGIIISEGNYLYVVGCNIDVYMFGDNMTDLIGSCMSICTDNKEIMERANVGGYCSGIGCCNIELPRDLPTFTINLVRHNSTVAEQDKALSKVKMFLSEYYSFALGDLYASWVNTSNAYHDAISIFDIAITDQPNCERAQLNKDSYACNSESSCNNLPSGRGYNCLCLNNYRQGNPYVVDGCIPDYNSTHKENCKGSCGNMTIPFPFGVEEGCYASDDFRLNCTPGDVTILDRGYAQYRVTNVSLLDDGILAVSNMLNATSSNNMERIINFNINGGAYDFGEFSVLDGIFDFSQEGDIIINWVVANLTCQQAMQRKDMYACVSRNSYCQNVTRGETRYGYLCKCNDGFRGNPYLPNSCTECSHGKVYDPTKHRCVMSAKEHNLILGITIGVACGIGSISVALGAIVLTRKWKKGIQRRIRIAYFKKNQGLLLEQLISNESTANKTKIFSLEEIEEATNNFDATRVLGSGGHGTVYKGILSDQRVVAIKKSKIVEKTERPVYQ